MPFFTQQDKIAYANEVELTVTLPKTLSAFIWHFLKPHKLYLAIIAIVALVWAVELSVSPYLFKLLIDGVSQYSDKPTLLLSAILLPAILYASMSLIININFRVYDYVNMKLFLQLYTHITNAVFEYTINHSYGFFQKTFSGSISDKIVYLPRDVEVLFKFISENLVPKTLAVLIAASMLLLVQPIFSMILFVWVIIFVTITCWLALNATEKSAAFSTQVNQLTGTVVDSISNIITAKIFANLNYEKRRLDKSHDKVNTCYADMQFYNLKLHSIQGIAVTILISSMLTALIYGKMHNMITTGDFVFVLTLSSNIIMNVWNLGQELINFTRTSGKCQQALALLQQPHEITETPNAKILSVPHGEISYQDVSFSYEGSKTVFKDFSITIPAGQKVGLVGYSGGGKSTFVKMLLRLFDIQSGHIEIDHQVIESVTLASLRNNITFIPQEPELFHRSIIENIRYGRLSASDDEVIDAAKKAHCHEFIKNLPEQYHTLVGERGIKLSGGQRQRIAIARAILKQAPILVLDEATSALDSATEKHIQASIHEIMQGKTTIVIAHRLSTLLEMDRILFFENGKIIEDGSLEALKANNQKFNQLWEMQVGGFLP